MVVMDTNYAAPHGSREGHPRTGSLNGTARVLRGAFVAAVLVQVALLYLSVPTPPGPATVPHADKLVHAAIFAAPALLGVLAGLRPWLLAVVLAAHAPVSELVQHFLIPVRVGDPWDMGADWVGVALGVTLGMALVRRGRGRSRQVR